MNGGGRDVQFRAPLHCNCSSPSSVREADGVAGLDRFALEREASLSPPPPRRHATSWAGKSALGAEGEGGRRRAGGLLKAGKARLNLKDAEPHRLPWRVDLASLAAFFVYRCGWAIETGSQTFALGACKKESWGWGGGTSCSVQ